MSCCALFLLCLVTLFKSHSHDSHTLHHITPSHTLTPSHFIRMHANMLLQCVVMAGLVWNPPTSCAWAARVFVNNREARDHGIQSVGLPSRLAAFNSLTQSSGSAKNAWWQRPSATNSSSSSRSRSGSSRDREVVELCNVQPGRRGLQDRPVVLLQLPAVASAGFLGPRMRLSLPSFRCVLVCMLVVCC